MSRTRLRIIGLAMVLLAGCSNDSHVTVSLEAEQLQGTWKITSARRDGEPDTAQVGAYLTFAGNTVTFHPKPVKRDDRTLREMALS
jgi:hypothetical protein